MGLGRHLRCWELDDGEELARAWATWREGTAACVDGGLLAASVRATPPDDAASALYRFTCSECGAQSRWFTAEGREIVVVEDASTLDGLRAAPAVTPEATADDGEGSA